MMLFDANEFEQKIEETNLKKGLKLFIKNKLELIHQTGNNNFTFFSHEKNSGEITIQLNSKKIVKYSCFCDTKNYCEHLAASIFYLQQGNLNFYENLSISKNYSSQQNTINSKKK